MGLQGVRGLPPRIGVAGVRLLSRRCRLRFREGLADGKAILLVVGGWPPLQQLDRLQSDRRRASRVGQWRWRVGWSEHAGLVEVLTRVPPAQGRSLLTQERLLYEECELACPRLQLEVIIECGTHSPLRHGGRIIEVSLQLHRPFVLIRKMLIFCPTSSRRQSSKVRQVVFPELYQLTRRLGLLRLANVRPDEVGACLGLASG